MPTICHSSQPLICFSSARHALKHPEFSFQSKVVEAKYTVSPCCLDKTVKNKVAALKLLSTINLYV